MINVAITSPDLQKIIEDKIKTGEFRSPDEVVAAGLQLLQQDPDDHLAPEELQSLRNEIQIGLAQLDRGQGLEWNLDALKAKLRGRLAR